MLYFGVLLQLLLSPTAVQSVVASALRAWRRKKSGVIQFWRMKHPPKLNNPNNFPRTGRAAPSCFSVEVQIENCYQKKQTPINTVAATSIRNCLQAIY